MAQVCDTLHMKRARRERGHGSLPRLSPQAALGTHALRLAHALLTSIAYHIMPRSLTIQLYVGANNNTHEVETDALRSVIETYVEGYTLISSVGFWKGQREPSVIVEFLATEETPVEIIIQHIKQNLHQDAVGYRTIPAIAFA